MIKRDKEKSLLAFATSFLSKVCGCGLTERNCGKITISTMATVSDEAFAIPLLECCWESWSDSDLNEYRTEVAYDETAN